MKKYYVCVVTADAALSSDALDLATARVQAAAARAAATQRGLIVWQDDTPAATRNFCDIFIHDETGAAVEEF